MIRSCNNRIYSAVEPKDSREFILNKLKYLDRCISDYDNLILLVELLEIGNFFHKIDDVLNKIISSSLNIILIMNIQLIHSFV